MCTNKRYIINKHGRSLLVSCGHCPACLQEKANKRANKIRSHTAPDKVCLFVGLTYANEFIPYFKKSEFLEVDIYESDGSLPNIDAGDLCRDVPIYRDYDYNHVNGKVSVGQIDTITIPFYDCDSVSSFKSLKNADSDKVGVCYYPDLQKFIKRLRINLKRKYHVSDSFDFYACSEYGSTSARPHFHVLFYIPIRYVELFRRAITEAWTYDYCSEVRKQIQVARNAAAYVASYVNCDTSIPYSLAKSAFRPKQSHSKYFGSNNLAFTLPKVLEGIRKGDLHYNREMRQGESLSVVSCLLPKYVLLRHFPKFKGFGFLSSDEIISICQRPSRLSLYARRLGYLKNDLHLNRIMLENKIKTAQLLGISSYDYALAYTRVWSVYNSNILRDFYINQINPLNIYYSYDNVGDFLAGDVQSLSLDLFYNSVPSDITDYNLFPENVGRTLYLSQIYHQKRKDLRVRNKIYSFNHNL